jgi:hypothetical protein
VAAERDALEIREKSPTRSLPCSLSDKLQRLLAESPPPLFDDLFSPRSNESTLSQPGITHPLGTIPPFPSSFPFGQTAADKLSLHQLTCIFLLARQKCRNTAKYHQLITITALPGEENLSSVSFDGTLLRGVTLRRVQCKPPAPSYRKMCSFFCRPECHLCNKKAYTGHQQPRRNPTLCDEKAYTGRQPPRRNPNPDICPTLPRLFICRDRETFCSQRDLTALKGLQICYRENQNDAYDPAKTQLLMIGQSLLRFAWDDLGMEDDKDIRKWHEIEKGG